MKFNFSNKTKGFTLVELATVVGIIAVILTVVLASKNIVAKTEIKQIMNQAVEYKNAIRAFYQIYNEFPGDTDQAYNLLTDGTDSNCTNAEFDSVSAGCNGDGNGSMFSADHKEKILVYHHLYLAELIDFNNNKELNINNAVGPGGSAAVSGDSNCATNPNQFPGINIPALNVRNAGVYTYSFSSNNFLINLGKGFFCHSSASKYVVFHPIFTPSEALMIDNKIDQGTPNSGLITAHLQSNSTCQDSGSYQITNKERTCFLTINTDTLKKQNNIPF